MIAVIFVTVCAMAALLIYFQSRLWKHPFHLKQNKLTAVINIELILIFSFLYFAIGIQRLFSSFLGPLFSSTVLAVTSLALYASGLMIGHYSYKRHWNPFHSSLSPIIFIMPFTIPFLFFIFISDIGNYLSKHHLLNILGLVENETGEGITIAVIALICLILVMIFFPPLIVKLWRCQKLEDKFLIERLESLCRRAKFTHAGFKVWSIMNHAVTAAILGVIAPMRYVIFTPGLLKRLSPQAIEAILAHEIGHSRHKHLLLYPFILSGIAVLWGIFLFFMGDFLTEIPDFFVLVFFSLGAWFYFRFIFGYFSRLFERQADLTIFELNLPSENLIEALHTLGTAGGGSLDAPNWHHYSIQQRIDFIKEVQNNPQKLKKHQKKVRYSLLFYFVILIAVILCTWL